METFSALLAICVGNSPVLGEFPTQRPVTRSFHVFFDLRLNKRFSKQSWGWWSETLTRPLWRHRNGICSFKAVYIILRTLPYQTPLRPLPENGAMCFTKSIAANTIHFAVSKTKISPCKEKYSNEMVGSVCVLKVIFVWCVFRVMFASAPSRHLNQCWLQGRI